MKKTPHFWDKKYFVISVDMFNVDVIVLINGSKQENTQWLKRLMGEKFSFFKEEMLEGWEDVSTEGRMIPCNAGFIVLLKVEKNRFRKFVGTLVHEMTHVSHYLLRDRRIPLLEDTEEVYTYLVQHLVTEALSKTY